MPSSLEARRRAVVDALRSGARQAAAQPADALEARLRELETRVASVETALLESAWSRPASARSVPVPPAGDDAEDEDVPRTAVPPLPGVGAAGRMSDRAARALFGH